EDEDDILELIEYTLARNGYKVTGVTTGEAALKAASRDRPALVLLDLMLPGLDGLEVCRRMKADPDTADIPVVMLTARGEEADVVTGLEMGADDYVTKPFSPRVLLARVKAVLRRGRPPTTSEGGPTPITLDKLTIDPGRHEVRLAG